MDNTLTLLRGSDISVGDIVIKQYSLKELDELGLEECQQLLLITILEPKDLLPKDALTKEELEQIDIYDMVCLIPHFNSWYEKLLNLFVLGDWEYSELFSEYVSYTFETPLTINRDNFQEVTQAIRAAYCMTKSTSEFDTDKATSNEVAKMLEEFEQVKKQQSKRKPKVTIDSIIESVTVKHPSYNLFNVWDLTLYQLMRSYYRIEHIESYDHIMRSIYAGVMSSKDIKIEEIHWANKASE